MSHVTKLNNIRNILPCFYFATTTMAVGYLLDRLQTMWRPMPLRVYIPTYTYNRYYICVHLLQGYYIQPSCTYMCRYTYIYLVRTVHHINKYKSLYMMTNMCILFHIFVSTHTHIQIETLEYVVH